ncbi:hypothetical protein [Corynebacterium glyciniphilum]|uniref:hypothetical protein n=1 Tax=Corynebacterium glyciniphilum TaxID=1404244 RepID=UPI0011AB5D98|nr:hypothetical protein [Corynebacterium glyciniphilum]
MSAPNPYQRPSDSTDPMPHDGRATSEKSATRQGIASLILCAAAVVSAPVSLPLPILGFLPAVFAGIGIILASVGLRRATHDTGLAVTGLVLSVLLFAALGGVATFWHVIVAGPTVSDPWFQDALDQVWDRLFGS